MKTFLKILLFIILFIIVAAFITPLLFKKQILNIAKEQANANLKAQVDIKDVRLSVFKRFPNLNVGLKGVSVVGTDQFEDDTLVSFDAFEVNVDIISAIKMDSIKIRSISLVHPVMNAIILEDGSVNWDIAKETEEEIEEPGDITETTGASPQVKLKKFEILDGEISYTDYGSDMSATLDGFNFNLSGDLSEKLTTLLLSLDITSVNFFMDGMRYLKDTRLNFLADIEADLENGKYKINKNELSLNELTLGIEGDVEMKEDDINTTLNYYTTNTSFKTLLSLVPAIYMKDFEDVETSGELQLKGTVIGTISDNILPLVTLDLEVSNAMFKYPDLPEKVDQIGIGLSVLYHGVFEDSTKVDLNKFHMEMAGNPIDLVLHVTTPMSDMHVNGNLKANLDMSSLAKAVPMEGTIMTGKVVSNIDIMGYLSSLENEQYEDFKADGLIQLQKIQMNSSDMDYDIAIDQMQMLFSPKYVDLKIFEMRIGNSDIQLSGKLENFIPYVFEDKTVKGNLNFNSGYLDLNQFMTMDSTEVEESVEEEDSSSLAVIEVPDNIDFNLKTNLKKVIYDQLNIDDVSGTIIIKGGVVNMNNLNLNTLGGFINVSGEYNTSDMENPFVDLDLSMTNIDISSTVKAFNTIEDLVPISKNTKGKISTQFTFSTFLQNDMTPRMNSIISSGSLNSKAIVIENSNTFKAIGDKLGSDKFKELTLSDLSLDFMIRDGKIVVAPFETKMGQGKAMIGGEQFLDQTINYTINLSMPKSGLGEGAGSAISSLTSDAVSKGVEIDPNENMNFDIKVGGTVTDPKILLDLKSNAKKAVEAVKLQMINRGKEEMNKQEAEAKAKANEEAQRILENAEKQSEQVLQQAKVAADKVKKEYNDKADKLEEEAADKPKFARDLAKKAADKVRNEGDEKAAKIIDEAELKSKSILENARKEANAKTQ